MEYPYINMSFSGGGPGGAAIIYMGGPEYLSSPPPNNKLPIVQKENALKERENPFKENVLKHKLSILEIVYRLCRNTCY